jgi:hypothetical protein
MINNQTARNRSLIIIIAILLIANIATMALFLMNRNDHGTEKTDNRKNAMRNYLDTELHFSDTQLKAFDSLKEQHRARVKPVFDSIRNQKLVTLQQLGRTGFHDSLMETAASDAASNQKRVELDLLEHIKAIRQLCTPEQLPAFDSGFYKILSKPPKDDKKKEK